MPTTKDIIVEIPAPYYFTDSEKLAIGKQMAETYQSLASVEDAKKQMTSQYKAQEEQMRATANLLQIKIINGYESRPCRCYVEFEPKIGKKFFRSVETGILIETRVMVKSDYEQSLPFEEEEKFRIEGERIKAETAALLSNPSPAPAEAEESDSPHIVSGDKEMAGLAAADRSDDFSRLVDASASTVLLNYNPGSVQFDTTLMNANIQTVECALKEAKGKRKKVLVEKLAELKRAETANIDTEAACEY